MAFHSQNSEHLTAPIKHVIKETWALNSTTKLIAFYATDLSEKHSKGLKRTHLCVVIGGSRSILFLLNSFCYCSDDWGLNIHIDLNSVFNIRKAVILYFINNIIKLQQRNEKTLSNHPFRRKCIYFFL